MRKITLFVLSLVLLLGVCSGLSGQTLLWTQDFASTAPTGWTVVNAGSGNDWSLTATGDPYSGTYHMRYAWNSSYAANTWAFTPGIAMTAGRDYYLTFWQKVESSSYPENLKVTVGNAQTVASQTTTVLTLASQTNTTYAQRTTASYRPTASGTYYFAFNCYSAADMYYLHVDYVQAYELVASGPANPTAFTATPSSATQIDLDWALNAASDPVLISRNTSDTFGTPTGSYSVGNTISGGGTVIYLNSGTSFADTGRDPNTTYYYKAWSQHDDGAKAITYSSGVTANATTGTKIIGTGTSDSSLPIEPYYGYSYSQSIFLQSEINLTNSRIDKIAYYWNGVALADASNSWTIYMGHTAKTAFSSTTDWVPTSAMTQVFSGTVELPATAGWIEISLTTPFNYNNMDNLVIAVDENEVSYDGSSEYFYCTSVATNRSIYYQHDGTNPDPATPPTATSLLAYYPNLRLHYVPKPTNPEFTITPSATSLDFGDVFIGDDLTQEYVISNTGGGGTISLTTPFATTGSGYFSIARQPLDASLAVGDTTSFVVKYAPTGLGDHSGSLAITYGLARDTHTISLSGRGVTTPVTMFEEDWESGSDGWTIVNGAQTNQWHLGTATYSSAGHSMYISNNAGTSNAYTLTATSVAHVYRDITFTSDVDEFTLEFDYRGYGEVIGENIYDAMDIYILPTSVTPVAGTDLYAANSAYYLGTVYNQANWVALTATLGSSYAGGTWRLAFQWYNDSSAGTPPPAAIDDIKISHQPTGAIVLSDGSWDYGLAFIGASNCTPRVFSVTNTSAETVNITNAPTITGTDAGQFTLTDANSYPLAIGSGLSASWTVKFTPTSWGEKDDAYLSIIDDTAKAGLKIVVSQPNGGNSLASKAPQISGSLNNPPSHISPKGTLVYGKAGLDQYLQPKANRSASIKETYPSNPAPASPKATNDIALRGFGVEGLMEDYFEYYSHRDQSFGYWTLHDKDLEPTYGIYIGETEYFAPYTGSFIVFDDQAVPELSSEAWMAYSGDNWVGSFDVATNGVLNDDWMVTPALDFDNDPRVSFFAKSPNTSYNPERFKVYYSLTGDAYSDFTGNYVAGSASTWIEPPTEWTKYEYSIPALANHTGWIAIQCVSDDSWVLQIDDFVAGHRSLYDVDPPIVTEILNVGATSTITVTVTNISASAWSYTGFSDTANWLTYTDASGTINPGDDIQIVLNFNATGLTANSTYTTNLVITTDFGSITVPVTLTVLAATNAIPVNPRMVAQWEDAVGVGIAWDYYNLGNSTDNKFGVPDALIVELSQTTIVFIACDTDQVTNCTNYLTGIGATLANCKFVNFPTNTYWTRDWGPWHIFHGDSRGREMSLVDFTYNRPRPLDDAAAGYINSYIEANYPTNYDNTLFNAPIIHTGGNIMTDGNGAAMSTNLVRDDNDGQPVNTGTPTPWYDYTDAQISAIMHDFLGIDNYMIFQDPDTDLNSTVDHMDCWCKLLDVDIVMIQRVPENSTEYQLTENAVTDWATRASSYGEHFPYRVHRVDEIPETTNYTNCFIHNRKIYVPAYGGDLADEDAAAIAAYKAAMPQYAVQGYTAKPSDPWLSSDAIHCRINTIWDAEMVHIWHHPLWGSVDAGEDIVLPIEITSYNALDADSTYVSYQIYDASTDTYGPWIDVFLGEWDNLGSNDYTITIPGANLALGDSIFYCIIANDIEGNEHWLRLNRRQDPFVLDVRQAYTLNVNALDQNGQPITGYDLFHNGFAVGQEAGGAVLSSYDLDDLLGNYSLSSPPEGYIWVASLIEVESTNYTGVTEYTIVFELESEDPLPIELSSFTATISATNFVNLTWITQSETGVAGYYILRNIQDDLANAVTLSQLIPATNTSQQQTYVYTDEELYEEGTYYYWLQNSDLDGTVAFHGPISIAYTITGGNIPSIPLVTELKPIYPNPFNPRAHIPFSLKESATVNIEIYNTRGQLVRRIPIGDKAAGHYQTEWDGRDDLSRACSTGVYHIRMTAGTESFFRKAVLMK
ncbi:MAG TPA: choice-of-anchor J domain-containing protein [Candidatus Syntrophosphaera sp.]|nr:choice-of-anchor J domain-containing protein [Candidatus Syntrophosphaera sp.]